MASDKNLLSIIASLSNRVAKLDKRASKTAAVAEENTATIAEQAAIEPPPPWYLDQNGTYQLRNAPQFAGAYGPEILGDPEPGSDRWKAAVALKEMRDLAGKDAPPISGALEAELRNLRGVYGGVERHSLTADVEHREALPPSTADATPHDLEDWKP